MDSKKMVRTFNILVSSDYGWEVDIVDFDGPYSDYDIVQESPASIGICVQKDKMIMAMYDANAPRDDAIIEANKHDIFKEQVHFTDRYNKHEFDGDFIDAFLYVQGIYKQGDIPDLETIAKELGDEYI